MFLFQLEIGFVVYIDSEESMRIQTEVLWLVTLVFLKPFTLQSRYATFNLSNAVYLQYESICKFNCF